RVYGLVRTPTIDDDSFWVRANGGNWVYWNSIPGNSDFSWQQVHSNANGPIYKTFNLVDGANTIEIVRREDGTALDKLYVTKTATVPAGFGGTDTTCGQSSTSKNQNTLDEQNAISLTDDAALLNDNYELSVFPNPASSIVKLSVSGTNVEIDGIQIYDISGRFVKAYQNENSQDSLRNEMSFSIAGIEDGVYYIRAISKTTAVELNTKLVIKK
ncbi:MAG: T9SS type A sorting domain-containing protein, partial [Flavobacteriaceae bacterium]